MGQCVLHIAYTCMHLMHRAVLRILAYAVSMMLVQNGMLVLRFTMLCSRILSTCMTVRRNTIDALRTTNASRDDGRVDG